LPAKKMITHAERQLETSKNLVVLAGL